MLDHNISDSDAKTLNFKALLDADAWREFLADETARLPQLGIRAGVMSIDVAAAEPEPDRDVQLRDRSARLVARLIGPTDRMAITSVSSLAILRSPLPSLPALAREARDMSLQLYVAGLIVALGYAHRRSGEDLLDTWARADAQADRASFRLRHPNGGLLLR